ncbi:sensor histidine kinase [Ornithinimicrobium cavernae]|uniref:sensor histidine kinase n=1 Tax=Ornithinimicrobium cavernae TaxID=2666047 RepID=UPI000D693031|nr:histidine kinase [Ornithinimicrobium cavernae]
MNPAVAADQSGYHDVPSLGREVAVGSLALLVLGLVAYGATLGFHVGNLHNALLALTFAGVGLHVLRARSGHRVGQLFVGLGLAAALMYFGRQTGLHDPALPGAAWLSWVSIWLVPLVMAAAGVAVMVFPTGQHLSPRWRVASHAMVGLAILIALASALWPIEDDWRSSDLTFPFTLGGGDTARAIGWPLMIFGYSAFQVMWAAAVVTRLRRADGDEVRQLRWFVFAVAVSLLLLFAGQIAWGTPLLGLLTLPLVPLAAGVAIVRYRLYDIDLVISRTLVGGILLLLISVGYVGVVVGVGALLPVSDRVLALAATAAVAVVFEPVRRRAQTLVDRLVYGRRATPYETLSRLSAQLARDDAGLLEGLAATIAGGVSASEVVVWVGDAERMEVVAAWPTRPAREARSLAELGGRREVVRPVWHDGVVQGALVLTKAPGEPLAPSEDQLLGDLVAQTGLVIDHRARLEQIACQTAELQAAARRIVTAEDAARRRIERNLHDGAQQRLVSLGMELGALVERAAAAGDADLVRRAELARQQLLDATSELREMARGVHPAVLTQDGLEAALANLVDRSPVLVRLHVALGWRLPSEVEATAYFMISEALTNAARHAHASVVVVDVSLDEDRLTVEVSDDGIGGAALEPGGGLQGLADRLSALGARLEVVSLPGGGGTTVRTVLACG